MNNLRSFSTPLSLSLPLVLAVLTALACSACGTTSTGSASAKTGGYQDSRDDWTSRTARLERGVSTR